MKYIIELEEIEGTDLYRAKGANTLVFDKNGIDKILKPIGNEEERKCPFEKDELVEVSDDGINWFLRYFVRMKGGKYACTESGYTSKESDFILSWAFCRKYGTLGGLVKGDEE